MLVTLADLLFGPAAVIGHHEEPGKEHQAQTHELGRTVRRAGGDKEAENTHHHENKGNTDHGLVLQLPRNRVQVIGFGAQGQDRGDGEGPKIAIA